MEKNWATLLKAPFIARLVVYLLVAVVAGVVAYEETRDTGLFVVMGMAFLLPYLVHWIPRRHLNINTDVVMIYSDGFVAGIISAWWSFHLLPSLILWSAVVCGSLLIGGPSLLVKASLWCLFGIALPILTGGVLFHPASGAITAILSGAILLIGMGIISYRNYRVRGILKENRKNLEEKTEQLTGLTSKLSKYLSPQVYDSIFTGTREVKIGTYRRKLTVFFSDIQGFTQLTDSMESEALTSILNEYQGAMSEIALRHGGTIDKFIGDAIMIFFGDPETKGDREDALACVLMALEMRERMKQLRKRWDAGGVANPFHIRMGINTGYCTVGNFGSEHRLNYTIVGGQVNLASRLEHAATVDQILISHETYSLVKERIACEKKEEIMVKGIAYPVQTYQVLGRWEDVEKRREELREETEGFSLAMDVQRIPKQEKERVLDVLVKAISRIKGK